MFAASIQNLKDNTPFLLGSYGASKLALNYCAPFIQMYVGNAGAKFFSVGQAVVPVKVHVDGIMKHIDETTREKTSRRFHTSAWGLVDWRNWCTIISS
ncbi:hypothetical protein DL769_000273 [Monosporascus sp. CRB-8-3]|nr:hypothetical protein DL769_000273 [Monosporascus sp. CRB-8-3]